MKLSAVSLAVTLTSAVILAALVSACGGASSTRNLRDIAATPASAAVSTAAPRASAASGEKLFRANCQTCHSLPRPSSKTDDQWPALVLKYGRRARLSPDQIQQITEYLTSAN